MPAPLALALAGAGVGIAGHLAAHGVAGDQRRNNERELQRLLGLDRRGELGLTDEERRKTEQQFISPLQAAARERRHHAETLGAAAQGRGFGPAQLAALRREEASSIGQASNAARAHIGALDMQRAQQQKSEIEARLAFKTAQTQELITGIFTEIAGLAEPLGEHFGQKAVGNAVKEAIDAGAIGEEHLDFVMESMSRDPAGTMAVLRAYAERLRQEGGL